MTAAERYSTSETGRTLFGIELGGFVDAVNKFKYVLITESSKN
jgi:hypothetical protein